MLQNFFEGNLKCDNKGNFKPNYALQPFKIAFYCSYSLMEKLHFLDFLQKKFYIIH